MNVATETVPSGAEIPLSLRGPAEKQVVVGYGFWLYLLSDIILFGTLFAAYAVLSGETNGGPSGKELFDKGHVFIETACLLISSVTCGLASLEVQKQNRSGATLWMLVTVVLGAIFLKLEFSEFLMMGNAGNGPTRSAFLSAFFTLVGAHGLHVACGLLWLLVLMAQMSIFGLQAVFRRRFLCFSLFWHALDIVWVGVFTIVYLGAR